MKRQFIWLILLLLLACLLVSGQNEYTSSSIEINFNITRNFQIVKENPEIEVDNIYTNFHLTPDNTSNQRVKNIKSKPEAEHKNNKSIFSWHRPKKNKYSYSVETILHNEYYLPKVHKANSGHNRVAEKYLQPTKIIDFNTPALQQVKEQINITTDDPFKKAHKIAEWVEKNIQYKSNRMTSAKKKSSWAVKNGVGNCDEITNVFISLCRSAGIPTRFVSGVAYSDSLNRNGPWDNHAWAEVYIGGYGWVPFDVTFGEFGYLDASHIKLMSKADINEANTVYETNTTNILIKTTKTRSNASIKNIGKRVESPLKISSEWIKNNTCFSSYNALKISVKNPKNYYVPSELHIRLPPKLKQVKGKKHILIPPKSKKNIHFIVKGKESNHNNYSYHTTVYTPRNYEVNSSFTADKTHPCYSLSRIKELISEPEKKDVTLSCKSDKRTYIVGEIAKIECSVSNKGKKELKDKLCLKDKCNKFVLEPTEKKSVNFSKRITDTGKSTLNINMHKQKNLVSYIAYKSPQLKISKISAPEDISFDEKFSINFTLSKENLANIKNCSVKIINDDINHEWKVNKIQGQRQFVLHVDNYMLSSPVNEFEINTQYSGSLGKKFSNSQSFTIQIENLNLWQRLLMLGNSIMHSLKYKFWEVALVIILSSIVTAIVFQVLGVEESRERKN